MSETHLSNFPDPITLEFGLDYLARVKLTHPTLAEQQLSALLDALLQAPPESGTLLELLEALRAPLCFINEEMARRYHNKMVPLSREEEDAFASVSSCWHKMCRAYGLCASLIRPAPEDPAFLKLMATILYRCIYYCGLILVEHYRARREQPVGLWLELHGYYASAEEWHIAYTPLTDPLENSVHATHCAAAYTALLLIDIASPYSHSVRNLNLLRHWAAMWSPLVSIAALDDDNQLPPYIVELLQDQPLHPSASLNGPAQDARHLDTQRLHLQIQQTLGQLRQRISPEELGLGNENSSRVSKLLEQLARPWSQAASPRRFRRFPSSGTAQLCAGFPAIYFHLEHQAFEQPDTASAYTRADFNALYTFRDQVDPAQALTIRPHAEFPHEAWEVINQSATGFRLLRQEDGQRLAHGQLVAVRPPDGNTYLLAFATWLMQEHSGKLVIGLSLLPGMPRGVAYRIVEPHGALQERFQPGFLLPSGPQSEDESIIVATGQYRAGREIEIFLDERPRRVRMNRILRRQVDFERISLVDV
ncbi:hypothetical protein [Azonexus sp.]|uniref:hypothetical protein n=1 Tax=Azonexus sp. TaxID=1872668 RepID=UPI0039E4BD02